MNKKRDLEQRIAALQLQQCELGNVQRALMLTGRSRIFAVDRRIAANSRTIATLVETLRRS